MTSLITLYRHCKAFHDKLEEKKHNIMLSLEKAKAAMRM
jgi:hypothetical protein